VKFIASFIIFIVESRTCCRVDSPIPEMTFHVSGGTLNRTHCLHVDSDSNTGLRNYNWK